MIQDAAIYREVLDNMDGGVMTLGLDGRILTFNQSAARILGLSRDEVIGHVFAEVFMAADGMDDFTQAVMDAIYDASIRHRRVIEIRRADKPLYLTLTTSYLRQTGSDGDTRNVGVIAIFTDISELMELREAELRRAEVARAQHVELQDAYRAVEERSRTLASARKRERIATACIVVMFLTVGAYAWVTELSLDFFQPTILTPGLESSGPDQVKTMAIQPQRLTSTITLSGRLAPYREVELTSPIDGTVAAVHFRYGERVTKGQRLVDLDTTDVESKSRDARAAYIKALLRFNELEDWENSSEVVRSRRALNRIRRQVETQRSKSEETAFLLEKGIIPASEHEAAQQQLRNLEIDHEAARYDLDTVLAKGGAEERQVAQLELDNARVKMEALEETLEQSAVSAPVTGIVLPPPREGTTGGQSNKDGQRLAAGTTVTQGARLLTIGDLDGLSVTSEVDEVDVAKIRPGQSASISGEAFPGVTLPGTIAHVSSQASQQERGRGGALPMFEVRAVAENLGPDQRKQLRLGMSAHLEVVVYDDPQALLVPLSAVQTGSGRTWVRVRHKTGAVERIEVGTGLTTLNAVEIVRGLEAGAEVILSGG